MSENISINGNEYDPEVVSAGVSLFRGAMGQNARGIQPTSGGGLGGADISSDATITRWLGDQYGGDRDVHKVLGYPDLDDDTALERYRARYEYQDIAARIIDSFPKETWKNPPEVIDQGEDSETEFERVANNVIQTELTSYLERLDRAQRLGEYGIMVVDYDDGQDLSEPVNEGAIDSVDDITYYSVFPQEQVEAWELGKESDEFTKEPTDERYNKPVRYYVDFGDIDAESQDDDFRWVHWSRVVPHAAEGALETDLKGEPALKKVFYRLVDREKVVGASAEMFWSGADEKIIANASEDFALQQYGDDGEREDFKQQLESLLHDMQKYIVSTGMEYEVIGGQEVDPTGVIDTIDSSIASAIGMPKNKLQGNETGERSTTQDRNNWFDNISTRQTNFAGPKLLRPVLERWISFGILPEPVDTDFGIEFPSLFELGETDIADNQQKRASMLQASGLAMTLSSEQKLDFLQEGPDAVDMEQETRELPIDENDERVQEQFLGAANESDKSPPQQAQTNAQAVLDVREKTDAMTDTGWNRAEMLAEGGELSESVIQKMAQFKRHQSNTEYENYSDVPESKKSGENPWWEDNGTVAWFGWGGTAGVEWAVEQSEQITENLLSGEFEPGYFGLDFDPAQNATQYSEGDTVRTPQGVGVVSDVFTESGEFAGKEYEASSSSPAYVVPHSQGFGIYKASQLSAGSFDGEDVDPSELAAENVANVYTEAQEDGISLQSSEFTDYLSGRGSLLGRLIGNEDPEVGFRTLPDGWDRTSVLQAWASLGGSFTSCRADMAGEIRSPARFCAAMKDEVLGTEEWRGGATNADGGPDTGNAKPFSTVPVLPSDLENLTKPWLVRWAEWIAAGRPEITEASALNDWNPALHPRDPRTGQFVERPFNIPDGVDVSGLSEQSPGELLQTISDGGGDVESVLQDDGVSIDGVSDEANSLDEIGDGESAAEQPEVDTSDWGSVEAEDVSTGEFVENKYGEVFEVTEVRETDKGTNLIGLNENGEERSLSTDSSLFENELNRSPSEEPPANFGNEYPEIEESRAISNQLEEDIGAEVDLAKFEPQQAQDIADNLRAVDEQYGLPDDLTVVGTEGIEDDSNGAGRYTLEDKTLHLNVRKDDSDHKELFDDGLRATKSMGEVATHEAAHALDYEQERTSEDWTEEREAFRDISDEMDRRITNQVSSYATTNKLELVAEVFAGVNEGNIATEDVDDDILELYENLGGPDLQ